tara:strand:+ start:203 stop:439 length:237 start_codon:yes stop_codon:yes gene_type:complete
MSAETYMALQRAVEQHVLDEAYDEADLVRDWVLVASTAGFDDNNAEVEIVVHRSPATALYSVTGLLMWGQQAYGEVEL